LLTSSAGIEVGTELSEHLHRLLASLEPVTALIWQMVQEGYEANWFCYVASHATEHAVELDRTTLQRLLALPGDLWLDVCGDDTEYGYLAAVWRTSPSRLRALCRKSRSC